MTNITNYDEIEKVLNYSVKSALDQFRRIYPEIGRIKIVGLNNNKTAIVIFVGDGYHTITDRITSVFYNTLDDAKKDL